MARPPTHLSLGRAGIAIFAVSILNYSNMSKFIELHAFVGGSPIYVNADNIVSIVDGAVMVINGKPIEVREKSSEIIEKIFSTKPLP